MHEGHHSQQRHVSVGLALILARYSSEKHGSSRVPLTLDGMLRVLSPQRLP